MKTNRNTMFVLLKKKDYGAWVAAMQQYEVWVAAMEEWEKLSGGKPLQNPSAMLTKAMRRNTNVRNGLKRQGGGQ